MVQVEGLVSLFSQRLAAHAPRAAAAVRAVIDDTSLASMALAAAGRPPDAYARHVAVSERRTYHIPIPQPEGTSITSQWNKCCLSSECCKV